MSHWDYRVVRRFRQIGQDEYTAEFAIHEAYYDEGVSKPSAITEDSIEPYGDDIEELERALLDMYAALRKPILDYETREEV